MHRMNISYNQLTSLSVSSSSFPPRSVLPPPPVPWEVAELDAIVAAAVDVSIDSDDREVLPPDETLRRSSASFLPSNLSADREFESKACTSAGHTAFDSSCRYK